MKGDKATLIKMLLHGLSGPITVAGQEYGRQNPIPMPPSGLEDQQIAEVLTYVRAEFARDDDALSKAEVTSLREAYKDRAMTFWTVEELRRKP